MHGYVAPAVYVEVADINQLLDTLIDILKKAIHVRPILVVVDSISAVVHPLTINHPDYAREKIRSLAHIARQLNQGNITLLVVSWHLGGYHGRYLNPALVIRTEKSHNGFRLIVKHSESMLTPAEELVPIGEVISIALAGPFQMWKGRWEGNLPNTSKAGDKVCWLRASRCSRAEGVKAVLVRSLNLQYVDCYLKIF
jgi:hypothetical protein